MERAYSTENCCDSGCGKILKIKEISFWNELSSSLVMSGFGRLLIRDACSGLFYKGENLRHDHVLITVNIVSIKRK